MQLRSTISEGKVPRSGCSIHALSGTFALTMNLTATSCPTARCRAVITNPYPPAPSLSPSWYVFTKSESRRCPGGKRGEWRWASRLKARSETGNHGPGVREWTGEMGPRGGDKGYIGLCGDRTGGCLRSNGDESARRGGVEYC